MNIQIERTTEALDQRHGTGVGRLAREARLFDQVRGELSVGLHHVLISGFNSEPSAAFLTRLTSANKKPHVIGVRTDILAISVAGK